MISYTELKIPQKLRTIRELKGFTREIVASELNIDPRTYGYIESGKSAITVERLVNICNVFGCSLSEFFEFPTHKTFNFSVKQENGNQGNNINFQENNNSQELLMQIVQSKDEFISQLKSEIEYLRVNK